MYSHKTQVTASHIGVTGYQTTVSVLSMMQDCSQLWFDNTPVIKDYLDANAVTMIMTFRQVDFLQEAVYGTPLVVKTGVYDCNGFTGGRNTLITNDAGELFAKSWSAGLFIDIASGKPARLPKELLAVFPFDEKLEMEYLDKRIPLPAGEPKVHPSFTAMRSDIDYNNHVNNTHYVRMACEFVPEKVSYGRMRVEYKLAAKLGDKLTPWVYDATPDAVTVVLVNEEEKPYALVEFSQLQVR